MRLRLNAAQRQQVGDILAHAQDQLKDLRQDFAPRFAEIMSNAQSEISATLTPEQRGATTS